MEVEEDPALDPDPDPEEGLEEELPTLTELQQQLSSEVHLESRMERPLEVLEVLMEVQEGLEEVLEASEEVLGDLEVGTHTVHQPEEVVDQATTNSRNLNVEPGKLRVEGTASSSSARPSTARCATRFQSSTPRP